MQKKRFLVCQWRAAGRSLLHQEEAYQLLGVMRSWSCSWICPLEVLVAQLRRLFLWRQEKMAPPASPSPSVVGTMVCARQGRLKQRYDGCYRLVSGCIPYIIKEDEGGGSLQDVLGARLQVLMISTPGRSDLIFPKGGWEDDESVDEAACREAFEEAGVKGIISATPLGEWIFKSKSKQDSCGLNGACKGFMFALQATELLEIWPEQAAHGRRWIPVEEAYGLCRYDWMREALHKLKEQLLLENNFRPPPSPELVDSSSLCMVMPAVPQGAVALC